MTDKQQSGWEERFDEKFSSFPAKYRNLVKPFLVAELKAHGEEMYRRGCEDASEHMNIRWSAFFPDKVDMSSALSRFLSIIEEARTLPVPNE